MMPLLPTSSAKFLQLPNKIVSAQFDRAGRNGTAAKLFCQVKMRGALGLKPFLPHTDPYGKRL